MSIVREAVDAFADRQLLRAAVAMTAQRAQMCFSATASFVTAGATALIGIVALARTPTRWELLLAATPLLFAFQQAVEGLLWLELSSGGDGSTMTALTFPYLFLAEAFWPVYAPLAVLLVEPDARRRKIMMACLVVGIGVGVHLLWWMLGGPFSAAIQDHHIVYKTEHEYSHIVAIAYLTATCLPLLLSSQRAVLALGIVVTVGSAISYALYWQALVSVWCYFAASGSVIILYHFESSRRNRLRPAGG